MVTLTKIEFVSISSKKTYYSIISMLLKLLCLAGRFISSIDALNIDLKLII
jgi:hypothetical protein